MQVLTFVSQNSSSKEAALQALTSLPEHATTEEMMYRLYVLEQVREGIQAAADNQTTSLSDLKREIEQW